MACSPRRCPCCSSICRTRRIANRNAMDRPVSILGNMTSAFTPAADCSRVLHTGSTTAPNYAWGLSCSKSTATDIYDSVRVLTKYPAATSCYPVEAAGSTADVLNYRVFSPALACPSAWTAVSHETLDKDAATSPTGWQKSLFTVMSHGETFVVCCPTYVTFALGLQTENFAVFD